LTQVALLTTSEQITLRRVAHGQAIPGSLRAQDLTRLRTLGLIDGPPRAPVVTMDGQRCFDALPRPVPLSDTTVAQALTDTLRSLRQGRQQSPRRGRREKARC
jgi:hypothetical protein